MLIFFINKTIKACHGEGERSYAGGETIYTATDCESVDYARTEDVTRYQYELGSHQKNTLNPLKNTPTGLLIQKHLFEK